MSDFHFPLITKKKEDIKKKRNKLKKGNEILAQSKLNGTESIISRKTQDSDIFEKNIKIDIRNSL